MHPKAILSSSTFGSTGKIFKHKSHLDNVTQPSMEGVFVVYSNPLLKSDFISACLMRLCKVNGSLVPFPWNISPLVWQQQT